MRVDEGGRAEKKGDVEGVFKLKAKKLCEGRKVDSREGNRISTLGGSR